jgi:hypothetical protein
MFIIDKKGVIREVLVGYDPSRHAEIEKLLQALLAEPAPQQGAAGPSAPPASPAPRAPTPAPKG